MKKLWNWIMNVEPAVALQVPTVVAATATAYWQEPWLGFLSAALAAVGALITRANVEPTETPFSR